MIKVHTDGKNWAGVNTEVDNLKNLIVLPGQLWTWEFEVGDGAWFLSKVSDKRQNNPWSTGSVIGIRRGETFIVVSTNDSGPSIIPDIVDDCCLEQFHVILINNFLAWMPHDLFKFATLVSR